MTATASRSLIHLHSADEYRALAAKIKAYDTETMEKFPPKRPGGGRSWPSDFPFVNPSPTNEERSAVETYLFLANPPERYTVYVLIDHNTEVSALKRALSGPLGYATTWMGQILGRICEAGPAYEGNICRRQMPISFEGINGYRYYGRWAMNRGTVLNVRAAKPCKGWRWDLYATGWNDTEYGIRTYPAAGASNYVLQTAKNREPKSTWALRMQELAGKQIAANPADSYAAGVSACVAFWLATGQTVRREG